MCTKRQLKENQQLGKNKKSDVGYCATSSGGTVRLLPFLGGSSYCLHMGEYSN